jgi:hypothetical protein
MHPRGQQMAKELIIALALSSQSNASNGGMDGGSHACNRALQGYAHV